MMRDDELELKPLGTSELDENARTARLMLQKALDKYKDARPLAFGNAMIYASIFSPANDWAPWQYLMYSHVLQSWGSSSLLSSPN